LYIKSYKKKEIIELMKKRIFFKEYMRLEKRDSSRNSMRNNTNNLKRKVEKEVFISII